MLKELEELVFDGKPWTLMTSSLLVNVLVSDHDWMLSTTSQGVEKGVALGAGKSRIKDKLFHFLAGEAVGYARRPDHILLEHYTSQVIGAEMKGNLTHFGALSNPRTLDVRNIVEKDAAHGESAEIIEGAGSSLSEIGVGRLEGPGDEGKESPGFVLKVPDTPEMFNAVPAAFSRAEHHGRRSRNTSGMGRLHDVKPLRGAYLERADAASDMVHQYLCSSSGEGVEARFGEEAQNVWNGLRGGSGQMVDLRRREAVKVDAVALFDGAEEGDEPFKTDSRVKPSLEHDLGRPLPYGFGDAVQNLVVIEEKGLGTLLVAEEGAESTAVDADVGVVDVAVDEKGDRSVTMERAADAVGRDGKVKKIGVKVEGQRIIFRKACGRGREGPRRQGVAAGHAGPHGIRLPCGRRA